MRVYAVIAILFAVLVAGCGVNKSIIARTAEGPKELFVNLQGDPLLISIELKMALESMGYRVDLNTAEVSKAVIEETKNGSVIYKNVSDSKYRYELVLAYQPIQSRIQLIAAYVRDRQTNEILGTYRWTWDRLTPAPTIQGAIQLINKNLLSKVFEQ